MRTRPKKQRVIWVIKAGSQMVLAGGPLLIRDWMRQVARLKRQSAVDVVWVTSGAIASARESLSHRKARKLLPTSLQEKQAWSAIGQPMVMDLYNLALQAEGLRGAQVLLSAEDILSPARKKNLTRTLNTLLEWNVVPVLNENDAVATAEIEFGDNDRLAALVARCLGADRLILLTDVDGLYDRNPSEFPNAQLISTLPHVPAKLVESVANTSGTGRGKGGMRSKLIAARLAQSRGMSVHLARGDVPNVLGKIAAGEPIGTYIGRKRRGQQ